MYLKMASPPDDRKDRSPKYKLVFDIFFPSRGLLCASSSELSVLLVSSTHSIRGEWVSKQAKRLLPFLDLRQG